MAADAGSHINFHVMGFYPITPSTEVAENLDAMKADGEHEIRMIAGDGEHGAAGICYGASVGGGRVLNVTSSQGVLYSLEQLPVQSGTRFPMVLNIACRAVSGPLDIRGDHSDLYFTLNTGWIILTARNAQAVYDMNFLAVRIGEHPDVRLPVIVAYDGFFTSHQKRRVQVFEKDDPKVRRFLGKPKFPYHALDPGKPVTFGPYMNDPDLINNKYQHHLAFEAARKQLPSLFKEYAELSGRRYDFLECYRMRDAEVAIFVVNSACRDHQGRRRQAPQGGPQGRRGEPHGDPALPGRPAAARAQEREGAGDRGSRRLVRIGRRQHGPRGQGGAEGRSRQPHPLHQQDLRSRRAGLLPGGRRELVPHGPGDGPHREDQEALRLPRGDARRPQEADEAGAAADSRGGDQRGLDRRSSRIRTTADSRWSWRRCTASRPSPTGSHRDTAPAPAAASSPRSASS